MDRAARAPKKLGRALTPAGERVLGSADSAALLRELELHQVELRTQNEELSRAHAALQESRDRYQELYDHAPVAYLTLDSSAEIVEANRKASALLGLPRAALLGRSLPSFMTAPGADTFHRYFQRGRAGRPRPSCEVEIHGEHGRSTPVRIDGGAFSDGEPRFRCVLVDLSQIREYQDRLRSMAFESLLTEQRERRRIAADLHDHVGQGLALLQMKLAGSRGLATGELRAGLDDARELLTRAIDDIRTFTFELSPPILYDLGLGPALSWLSEKLETRHGLCVDLDVESGGLPAIPSETAALLFRLAHELLMNVLKHAKVERAEVLLRARGGELWLEVNDRGAGFDPDSALAQGGFGLFSLREQCTRLGGRLELQSAPGRGTRARIALPNAPSLELPRSAG
jgi:PAS domain S-box-containing protein